jgi:hypothetical protein
MKRALHLLALCFLLLGNVVVRSDRISASCGNGSCTSNCACAFQACNDSCVATYDSCYAECSEICNAFPDNPECQPYQGWPSVCHWNCYTDENRCWSQCTNEDWECVFSC